jgi:uncharacterized Zn-binding protein involved in type VI secretion
MPQTATIGSLISHGGSVFTGSPTRLADGAAIARVGDLVACDQHGVQSIISGSESVILDGSNVARVGDGVSCGAFIITGSTDTITN